MTAEIAVLNKFGVALAADSAVTVEHFHENKIKTKVYNTANKLFTLSKYEPIGIMYYNTVTLGGVPWETIIKSYRKKLGKNKFDHVEQYCDDFFSWLDGNFLFSETQTKDIVDTNLIREFVGLVEPRLSKKKLAEKFDKEISTLRKLAYVEGFDDKTARDLINTYKTEIDAAASAVFKPSHISGQKKKLYEYVSLLLTRKRALPSYSGIVIAGFGEAEALPALREFAVDIVVSGRVRRWLRNAYFVNERNPSEVVPLADAEVIRTLTEGISPGFERQAYSGALNLILSMPKTILDPIAELTPAQKQKYIAMARHALPQHFQSFSANMSNYRYEQYTRPIKQAISSLPIGELGAVAETFLGASQIEKRISPELETVGGPVDVAVISKGDGFVWIKRKHYFEEKFNPTFKIRYFDQ